MSEVKEPKIDKSKWGNGPWQTEPDRMEWEEHGFPCMAIRTRMGNWCGYVGVPKGHPAFEKAYDDVDVDVHGGLTYADHCEGHICHVPKPGQPDNVWWLGFDCAHAWDYIPGTMSHLPADLRDTFKDSTYRDLNYVKSEVSRLAQQLGEKK